MPSESADSLRVHASASPSAATRQILESAFPRGKQLFADKNFDYAHEMFGECVMKRPDNLEFVEMMLTNLRAKFDDDKNKVRFAINFRNRRRFKQAIANRDWRELLNLGIAQLAANPWHVPTLRALAEMCAALHYNEVELAYLKQALDAKPKDPDVNRHCARSLARMGQFDQAIACWHRIETVRPGDKEASRMIGELSEKKLTSADVRVSTAKRPAEATAVMHKQDAAPAVVLPEIRLTPQQQLERSIASDPYDVANYLELAKLFCANDRFDDADRILRSGIDAVGERQSLMDGLQRVQQKRAEVDAVSAKARRMAEDGQSRSAIRVPWLELILGIAGIALLSQLFPNIAAAIWRRVGFASWSRTTLFIANVLVLLVLCAIRYGPEVFRSTKKVESIQHRARIY